MRLMPRTGLGEADADADADGEGGVETKFTRPPEITPFYKTNVANGSGNTSA